MYRDGKRTAEAKRLDGKFISIYGAFPFVCFLRLLVLGQFCFFFTARMILIQFIWGEIEHLRVKNDC